MDAFADVNSHVALDDQVVCSACGSVLLFGTKDPADEEEQVAVPPKKTKRGSGQHARSVLRHVSQSMLKFEETRRACRVAMLAMVPGIGVVRANALVRAYPTATFEKLMAASLDELASLHVKNRRLGMDMALAIKHVLQ
jgi:hypothetical protein